MNANLNLHTLCGEQLLPFLDEIARLRIAVFHDWPYLYQGDLAYERDYLAAYAATADAVCVIAQAGQDVVGASTGLPLSADGPAFQQPFIQAGMDPAQVFYFGESVLLPHYRGRGIGHAFFDAREKHARALGIFSLTAFCSVDRDENDSRRPANYRSNELFWRKRGYTCQPDMRMFLDWEEIERGQTTHSLTFWTRKLEKS